MATVLIVEDNSANLALATFLLQSAGHVVLSATSAEVGLTLARDERPDLILMDIQLPGMDGLEATALLKRHDATRAIPVIALTALAMKGDEERIRAAGCDAYIAKPMHYQAFLATVAARLAEHPPNEGSHARTPTMTPSSYVADHPARVLIVDDEPHDRQVLEVMLASEGWSLLTAASGEEALALVAQQPPDLILLDVIMPGMDGYQVVAEIKGNIATNHIPIVMVAALSDRHARMLGLDAGAEDFLAKPVDRAELCVRVRNLLRLKASGKALARVVDELERKNDELTRKNRELDAFSYSVTHDLRAPLRAVKGFTQIVIEESGQGLDVKARDHLERVRAAAQRMDELIDDLLNLSRVGRATLRREPTSLSEIGRRVIQELRDREPRRLVDVVIQDELTAEADRGLMGVVLENLIGNSWKFTGKVAAATIEFTSERSNDVTVYFIRDNGAGFDMAQVERLFRPFQRLHQSADFPGTGIGLATVQRVIERHGGRVWAKGAVGGGATVYFTIPPVRLEVSA